MCTTSTWLLYTRGYWPVGAGKSAVSWCRTFRARRDIQTMEIISIDGGPVISIPSRCMATTYHLLARFELMRRHARRWAKSSKTDYRCCLGTFVVILRRSHQLSKDWSVYLFNMTVYVVPVLSFPGCFSSCYYVSTYCCSSVILIMRGGSFLLRLVLLFRSVLRLQSASDALCFMPAW